MPHGTTTLFAALEVATGTVITDCKTRHRHQEFFGFLRRIDANVPADLDVHLIVDNYVTHKHARVKAWLAKRPRYHVHYTPTYASWINQVERWFGIITEQAIRRGSFRSVPDLVRSINRFVEQYNAKASPFVWTATRPIDPRQGRETCILYFRDVTLDLFCVFLAHRRDEGLYRRFHSGDALKRAARGVVHGPKMSRVVGLLQARGDTLEWEMPRVIVGG